MIGVRRLVVAAWLGFALAALFFYPLAVGLDSDIYYMQWQPLDTVETAAALVMLTVPLAFAVFHVWGRTTRGAAAALLAIAAVPLASFVAGVSRQLPFDDFLRTAWENSAVRFVLPAAAAAFLLSSVAMWPEWFVRWFRRLLIAVSPVSLVVVGSLVTSLFAPAAAVALERTPRAMDAQGGPRCASVMALLFDELSYSYLYDENSAVRDEFPGIRRFASAATNYSSVAAPGRETLVSMTSFLAARHLRDVRIENGRLFEVDAGGRLVPFAGTEPAGLFATARRLGFTTGMAGYYLPYCELLGDLVDRCRSLSFYNYSAVQPGFSPAAPVLTTFVMWPRQFPFGLLKNPAFARFQLGLARSLEEFAARPVASARPVFHFVHFSVPHLPFVFDAEGYDPPFDPLRTAPDDLYVRQLHYADAVVERLVGSLRASGRFDSSTIVLLADHGFRFGGRERDPLQIPFIVKMAGQKERVDVHEHVAGEALLKQVVEDSCRASPPPQTSAP
jgi:hypothetical protein